MKIAVISDTHDHLENVERAVSAVSERGAALLLHCGDICSPFVIDRLAGFRGRSHVVFGNNDGDHYNIFRTAAKFPDVVVHHHAGFVETEGGIVAFTHYPEFGRGLAATGEYAAVFSGHTHRRMSELVGGTPHLNPGELMGLLERPGCIVFDLAGGQAEHIEL